MITDGDGTPPIPIAREAAYDVLARHIEELNDTRIREHSDIRKIHKRTDSQQCQMCRESWPCATMRAIGQEAAV